ncbi:hypothetical protein BHE74_00058901 [Ensete ventricosum]|nr:hypothetical protein BHE74_00058901 [Ensete ventricosum]RZR84199.1 hypothetical protein BHM03_00010966 [Ensete ventricosum]
MYLSKFPISILVTLFNPLDLSALICLNSFSCIYRFQLSTRFLKQDKKTADLVGNEKLKASASVRHLVLPCTRSARPQIIPDVIRCYSRFVILTSGRFLVLVATNVAARGLDINDVQLIIQGELEGLVSCSGNTGVAILLYEPKQSFSIFRIERESGVKFEHISAPQPTDIAESAGSEAVDAISNVSDRLAFIVNSSVYWLKCSVIPVFRSQAEHLLSSSGLSAVDILAKALAKAAVSCPCL